MSQLVTVTRPAAAPPGVAVLSMTHGINVFDLKMFNAFGLALKDLEADPTVNGVVITSANPKVFSAGLDLKTLVGISAASFREFWISFEDMIVSLYTSRLATVAAVGGQCPALGAIIALSADYRLMVDNPRLRIGLNETSLGMTPPRWLQAMLADTVGTRVAQHALQRSLMSTPTEAVAMGLVDELCGADALTQLAYDRLATFTRIPPLARAETKLQQRAHIAEMTGPQSVADMSRVVLSDEFQTNARRIVESLNKPKKATAKL